MGLSTRIQKLEVVAAPIKAEQQRRREAAEFRELIFRERKDFIEEMLTPYRYVLGDGLDEKEATKDIVEIDLLFHDEATERFGINENRCYKATPEQLNEISREVIFRFDRRIFGNYQTVEKFNKEQEQWKQARADMEAGVDSAESEAAEYIRQLFKRYPRNLNAKRFYDIWD
jgi:5'-deoxynucleotidase YfbR-like HD superfamily hydrolase